ncbi:unnamed protein product [Malus baccata var. baccata]
MSSDCSCSESKDPKEKNVDNANIVAEASSIPIGAPQIAQSGTTTTVQVRVSLKKSSSGKEATGLTYIYDLLECEDECPTCLEVFSPLHYHLSCISEWMERSSTCPICTLRVMIFSETS